MGSCTGWSGLHARHLGRVTPESHTARAALETPFYEVTVCLASRSRSLANFLDRPTMSMVSSHQVLMNSRRRTPATSVWVVVSIFVALSACEGSTGNGEPPPGLADGECEAIVEVLCTRTCDCECELSWLGSDETFADAELCQTTLVDACDGTRGTESQGSACNSDVVDAVSDYACGMPLRLPATCERFFEP